MYQLSKISLTRNRKMSGKSSIWDFFAVTENPDKATCNSCDQDYSCKNGTTSCLINHLKSKHKDVHQRFIDSSRKRPVPSPSPGQKSKQPRIEDCLPVNEERLNEAIDEAVVDFLADSGVAFRVVGLPSFKNMLNIANRKIKLKHPQTYSRSVKVKAQNIKNDISSIIDATKEDFDCAGFTTDLWTSRSGHPFMSLTVHFIDKDWNLHRFTPFVAPFPANHTGKNIGLGLDAMVEALGLTDGDWELFSVNDNASNMKLGIKLSRHLKQYLCDIHTLELAVKDTFKNVPGMKSVTKKCKAIGKFTHKSTEANKALVREAMKEGIKFKKVVNPPNTRWSGYHDNLASVLHLKKAIMNLTANNDAWAEHELSVSDWKLIEGAVTLLKPVRDSIKAWEGEKEPTMHRVIERIYSMHTVIDDFVNDPHNNRYGIGFARELKNQIKKRFPNTGTDNKLRRFANYLAPQYKGIHLDATDVLEDTKAEIKAEVFDANNVIRELEPADEGSNEDITLSPTSQLRRKMLARNHRTQTEGVHDSRLSPIEKEFRRYEAFSLPPKNVNILQW